MTQVAPVLEGRNFDHCPARPLSRLEASSVSAAVAPRWVQSSRDGGSDEDVKGRKGSRPQTRPWRERAKGGSRSR